MNLVANILTKVAKATVGTNCFLFWYKGDIPAELLKK
ncbi:cyclic lactone autoinducer peptide [Paenibacillus sp. BAC0078]